MLRIRLDHMAFLAAGLLAATGAAAADELKKPQPVPTGFYRKFFEPRMTSRLTGDAAAAAEFADRAANPWTRDDETVSRIEKNAIRATKKALKQYVVESLRIDTWSIPLFKTGNPMLGDTGSETPRARLRFGISHLAPRAELQVPSGRGRAAFSADARGGLGAWFETTNSNFRLGVSYNVPEHAATFTLNHQF